MSEKNVNNNGGIERFGYKQELKRALSLKDIVLTACCLW
jgi:hypothetical protein